MRAFYIFVVSLLLAPISRGEAGGSVFFIDGQKNQYIRERSSVDVHEHETPPMSSTVVSAAVTVLLGFAPLATLTADGSSKLNSILKPNPFEIPRTVFMLEVAGADDALVRAYSSRSLLGNAFKSNIVSDSFKADIELPDESEVAVVSLDEPFSGMTDKDISDLVSWIGGSYVADSTRPLAGVVSIPLSNGDSVEFHLAKNGERRFAMNLLVLSQNIRQAISLHEDLLAGIETPAELMVGRLSGINDLREESGEGKAKQGMEILLATLSRIFNLLQKSHQGKIVGLVVFDGRTHEESEKLLNVVHSYRESPRWLAEENGASNSTTRHAEILIVRRTLAWLTGIILLVATLLGIYFMVNMPLTRDTLLYANVKLD
ncbi:PREDICTED: uncharacterized protein LOC104804814 [Tarenaya hassleriana]|uniref:uncharacterized protein LOC104804814 n=1 Tax=Tarenaya hassleriana TaxID=28532 RepID=UPI00053C4207|nr:PREDICTED: uncharacterized protein LOC104804814 [Tarenaya hassleriana]XP_010527483.1 PREDICTED: uncharacterized protein LOC104804814 [Tarenaya hassleriana]